MALNDLAFKGVKLAAKLTKSFQGTVQHMQWAGQNGFGDEVTAAPVARRAIITQDFGTVKQPDGTPVRTTASLLFLDQFSSPAGFESLRTGPVDPRDHLVLPDGSTGPIVRVTGPYNPGTGKAFILQVWLGAR